MPYFSICIPTYNRAEMLAAAIESVLPQGFRDFELIICDDASTDDTENIVRRYSDARIRYVRCDQRIGLFPNHNRCIRLASAPWIVILHHDDRMAPSALQVIAEEISAHPFEKIGLAVPRGDRRVVRELNRPWVKTVIGSPHTSALTLSGLGSPSVVCFSAAALHEIGWFSEDAEVAYTADHLAYACLASAGWLFLLVDSPMEVFGEGPHRATNWFSATGESVRCLSHWVARMSKLHNWRQTMDFLEIDLPQWPCTRAAHVLYLVSIAGLSDDYLRLVRACAQRSDILGTVAARRARLAYWTGPKMYLLGTRWARALRRVGQKQPLPDVEVPRHSGAFLR